MPKQTNKSITNHDLAREIHRLNKNLDRVSKVGGFSFAHRPGRFVGIQFGVGVVRGVGSAIGATVVLALLLGVLRFFPFTQRLIDYLNKTI